MAEVWQPIIERELFKQIDIRAVSGGHALLENGAVPIVGYITDRRRFTKTGCVIPRVVCFHYGNPEHSDFFTFEDGHMVSMSVSIKTPGYLTDLYVKMVRKRILRPETFIGEVLDVYVNKELGL